MRKVVDTRRGEPDVDWWREMVTHRSEPYVCTAGSRVIHFGWISHWLVVIAESIGEQIENRDDITELSGLEQHPVVTLTPVTLDDK